jgi:hypothetical protein
LGTTFSKPCLVYGAIPKEFQYIYNFGSVDECTLRLYLDKEKIKNKKCGGKDKYKNSVSVRSSNDGKSLNMDDFDMNRFLSHYDFKGKVLVMKEVRSHLFNIGRVISEKRRVFNLGPEKETYFSHFSSMRMFTHIGFVQKDQFVYFSLNDHLNLSFPYSFGLDAKESELICPGFGSPVIEFSEKALCNSDMVDIAQVKLFSSFFHQVQQYDFVIYLGSYPGVGWIECLHDNFRSVSVLAIDPKYGDAEFLDGSVVHADDRGNSIEFVASQPESASDVMYIVGSSQLFSDWRRDRGRVILISDIRTDVPESVHGDGYEWSVRNEFLDCEKMYSDLMMNEELKIEVGFFKIRVNTLLQIDQCLSYFLIPHYGYYKPDGPENKSEVIGVLFSGNVKRVSMSLFEAKLREWVSFVYSKLSENQLLVNQILLRIYPLNYLHFDFTSDGLILAQNTLSDSKNDPNKIIDFILSHDVIGVGNVGVGGLERNAALIEGQSFEDYRINNLRLLKWIDGEFYNTIKVWALSTSKFHTGMRNFRLFFRLKPEISIKLGELREDLYIKDYLMSRIGGIGYGSSMYNEVRRKVASDVGRIMLDKDEELKISRMTELERSRYIENYFASISGHFLRLILINEEICVNLGGYVCLIIWSFVRHRRMYIEKGKYHSLRDLHTVKEKDLSSLAYVNPNVWHSVQEWKLAIDAARELIISFYRRLNDDVSDLGEFYRDFENLTEVAFSPDAKKRMGAEVYAVVVGSRNKS